MLCEPFQKPTHVGVPARLRRPHDWIRRRFRAGRDMTSWDCWVLCGPGMVHVRRSLCVTLACERCALVWGTWRHLWWVPRRRQGSQRACSSRRAVQFEQGCRALGSAERWPVWMRHDLRCVARCMLFEECTSSFFKTGALRLNISAFLSMQLCAAVGVSLSRVTSNSVFRADQLRAVRSSGALTICFPRWDQGDWRHKSIALFSATPAFPQHDPVGYSMFPTVGQHHHEIEKAARFRAPGSPPCTHGGQRVRGRRTRQKAGLAKRRTDTPARTSHAVSPTCHTSRAKS